MRDWTYEGLGMRVQNYFKVDARKGKWSLPCCRTGTKRFVIRNPENYGNVKNLDTVLDEVDKILNVFWDYLEKYICIDIFMQETSISPQILTAVVFIISVVCVSPVFMMIFTEKIPVKYIQMPIIVPIVITIMFNGLLKCYFYWKRITRLGETLQRWNR